MISIKIKVMLMAGKKLIIVESPAKVKTIKKFLGRSYTVDATYGHLIDMPKSTLGVDIENDYEPKYITIRGKGERKVKHLLENRGGDCVCGVAEC